ncbi:MAG: hypothetical protein O3A13_03230 [Proteobacteria bacterium]|nr:hypothetical protein [Pseudomonadota bacterium]MDA0992628.1 hypothetical protein [Pseudomonadota bacterium]
MCAPHSGRCDRDRPIEAARIDRNKSDRDSTLVVNGATGEIEQVGGIRNRWCGDLFLQRETVALKDLPRKLSRAWRDQIGEVLQSGETRNGEFIATDGDQCSTVLTGQVIQSLLTISVPGTHR